ncbi:hypothetical protein RYZ20_10915 [Thioclava sp. A2]|uniref:hypothetical protein n=1 Tax=Thioclava sp. FCG-A2 TaxID=3080562 RepID=UPI0029557907|nr:hypothetical protein [Thioclava sp. A2]MDV7271411.1 hypothetical protein [Thioclava sp. A2]
MTYRDKVGHFAVGALIATGVGGLTGWPIGFGLAVTAGLLKEAWDSEGHGHVEAMDFVATAAGGVLGAVMVAVT